VPALRQEYLLPCSKRILLSRALGNLRMIYTAQQDWPRLEQVLHRLAAVEPSNGAYLCELASLHARRGNMRSAYAHLLAYLERTPNDPQARQVRNSLRLVERAILAYN
jgi:regulator of sirC expression with transglutaminase-like and TPR domain